MLYPLQIQHSDKPDVVKKVLSNTKLKHAGAQAILQKRTTTKALDFKTLSLKLIIIPNLLTICITHARQSKSET